MWVEHVFIAGEVTIKIFLRPGSDTEWFMNARLGRGLFVERQYVGRTFEEAKHKALEFVHVKLQTAVEALEKQ